MSEVRGRQGDRVGDRVLSSLRRLSLSVLAGAVVGFLVGGVLGRLAMMLLARLNPEATGVISDDGFSIGQTTLSGTANLFLVATVIGAFGGAIYLVLRALRFGSHRFQLLAVTVGPAVVVGSMLVHDGVDFTLLQPVWLAIALFVAIPALYGGLLMLLTDRWLLPSDRPDRPNKWILLVPRIALGLVFAVSLADLVGDITELA